ncbi:MAG: SCO family protein [Pseudomonadota bacterium]
MSSLAPILGAGLVSIAGAIALIGLPERAPAPVIEVEATLTKAQAPSPPPMPGGLPFPVEITAEFDLTDHHGNRVTHADFRGQPMLLFFGYASCESICTVALPRMGEALAEMGPVAGDVAALMVTVDPERDTPEAMRQGLARWHERLVGLTGSEADLAALRARFQVNLEVVAEDPTGAPIYAHGGFIYVIDRDGKVATMLPPILAPERIAEVALGYF